jgi:hypothetical protein
MRVRDHQRIGTHFRQLGADAGELVGRRFPGKAQIVQGDRAERRGRAVAPDRVDQVGLDRDQRGGSGGARLAQPLRALDRVQPGIVAKAVVGREVSLDPAVRRVLDQVLDGEKRRVHLLARLQRVATVDEQHRPLHQHDRRTGGTGEAAEPGEALLAGGDIFILVAIGARHDPAGQIAPCQLGAQRCDARTACRTLGSILERLEAGFEHAGNLWGRWPPGNAPTAWQPA